MVNTAYQYRSDNNRLSSINTISQSAGGLMNLQYTYDNMGNIRGKTDSIDPAKTRTYKYDDLNRLIEANNTTYYGGTLVYQYDKIGNMTYNCKYGYYHYDDPNHKHAVTSVKKADGSLADPNSQYAYDDNGNMTGGAGRTFTYDYDNRPTSIATNVAATISVYDASGQRVKKVVPGATTVYIGSLYECTNSQCTKYIFAGSQRVAQIDNTGTYYYHTDHLGSSSVLTDNSGNKAQELFYYPYGEIILNLYSNVTKYKFTGQEYDAETGLIYMGARYYDPRLGRFTSADTIVPNPGDPQSLNRYSYCLNNPVNLIDPTGHFSLGKFLKSVVTGIVGGVVFVLSGGTAAPILAGIMAGMAAGATSAALNGGNVGQILQGAVMGGVLGGIGGGLYSAFGATGAYAMAGAGAAYATATGGLDGLAYYAGGVLGGMAGYGGASYIQKSLAGSNASAYEQYAEAYTSDASTPNAQGEINELTRLTYAEAAGQYNVDNTMEGVAWTVRNRVDTVGWPGSYSGVIHQRGQFSSVGGELWNAAGNPQAFSGRALAAYSRAFTVASGVYHGTIADPTGGALYFHSGAITGLPAKSAAFFGTLTRTERILPFYFYK